MNNVHFLEAKQHALNVYLAHLNFIFKNIDKKPEVIEDRAWSDAILRSATFSSIHFSLKCANCGNTYLFLRTSDPLWCELCNGPTDPARIPRH